MHASMTAFACLVLLSAAFPLLDMFLASSSDDDANLDSCGVDMWSDYQLGPSEHQSFATGYCNGTGLILLIPHV